jgi:hypothetical protein
MLVTVTSRMSTFLYSAMLLCGESGHNNLFCLLALFFQAGFYALRPKHPLRGARYQPPGNESLDEYRRSVRKTWEHPVFTAYQPFESATGHFLGSLKSASATRGGWRSRHFAEL